MTIRKAEPSDADQIRLVHLAAFEGEEAETVAGLAIALLNEPSTPETIHLVADTGDNLAGHVAFSPVWSKEHHSLIGYILAPLAVAPLHQSEGLGTALVEEGLQQLGHLPADFLFVYGDPAYYARFGFVPALAEKFPAPCELKYPFGWQALPLTDEEPPEAPEPIECVPALNRPELW